ncbi:MAG: hypothetical protein HKP30_11685 [Myxococcales bacterium]|nr:hypothetical protein [Myxococcales bacterium]
MRHATRTLLILSTIGILAAPAPAADLGIEARPEVERVANPESGPALRIARVTDRRSFSASAAGRWRPIAFEVDPTDTESLARIVARTRGSDLGGRGGNVVLADGATVESLVADVLTQALRRAGYRVLEPGGPGHASAAPVEADVTQFWGSLREPRSGGGYASRGSYRFEFRIAVRVLAAIPGLREGQTIAAEGFAARDGRNAIYWSPALRSALASFDAAVRERVVRPDAR